MSEWGQVSLWRGGGLESPVRVQKVWRLSRVLSCGDGMVAVAVEEIVAKGI